MPASKIAAIPLLLAAVLFGACRYSAGTQEMLYSKKEKALAELSSLQAYNQYFQGLNYWNKQDENSIRRGVILFKEAIRLDSGLARAYSGLADCYAALGYGSYESPDSTFPKAEAAAMHAIQLDPSLADAHSSLGYTRFYYYRDWAGAEKEFTKAIQADPYYAIAFDAYTYYLTAMERFPEAGIAIEKALQIDPLSPKLRGDKGFFLYYSGHYPEAIEYLRSAAADNPRSPLAHVWLGRSYAELKMYRQSEEEFQTVLQANRNWPVALAALGYVYGISGHRQQAQSVLDTLLALQRQRFVTPYAVGLVYAALDKKDEAFACLEKAYIGHSNWLVWLNLDPRWQNIRDDRRFTDLARRVGLVRAKGL